MLNAKTPNLTRYQRVASILESDPAIRSRLGPKTETIAGALGKSEQFSWEVIAITNAIHTAGLDAHAVLKQDILKDGVAYLILKTKTLPAKPAAVKAVFEPEPAPVQVKPAEPAVKKRAPRKPKAEEPEAPEQPAAPAPPEKKAAPSASDAGSPPPAAQVMQRMEYSVSVSVFSLLATVYQLLELHDRSPGAAERLRKLDAFLTDAQKVLKLKP